MPYASGGVEPAGGVAPAYKTPVTASNVWEYVASLTSIATEPSSPITTRTMEYAVIAGCDTGLLYVFVATLGYVVDVVVIKLAAMPVTAAKGGAVTSARGRNVPPSPLTKRRCSNEEPSRYTVTVTNWPS